MWKIYLFMIFLLNKYRFIQFLWFTFKRNPKFCSLTLNFSIFRNAFLENKGFPAPKATKTGTTIAGLIYKDGVILGADTRATSGNIVADKNCEKIHYLAPNM